MPRQGQLLISLLADRKDDDEFVLQIIVSLHTLLGYQSMRNATLGTSEACPLPSSIAIDMLPLATSDSLASQLGAQHSEN